MPGLCSQIEDCPLPEVVNDTTPLTEMSQSTYESKQPVETSVARAALASDNKAAHLGEVASDVKPLTEYSQNITSESKQFTETSNVKPVVINGNLVDYCNAPPPHKTRGVVDLGAIEAPLTMKSFVAACDMQNSIKLAIEDEITAGTDNGTMKHWNLNPSRLNHVMR